MKLIPNRLALAIASAGLLTIYGCGGGGGGSPIGAAPTTLSGVAATGAAMAGALITITDSNGLTATKTAGTDGAYSADVSSFTAPFSISAVLQVGDTTLKLMSMVAEKPAAGRNGIANVTPLTHAMAALVAPSGNPVDLEIPATLKANVTKTNVDGAANKINSVISNILTDAGLDPTKFNPVSTIFTANRLGADRVLELARVEVTGSGVTITNPAAVDDGKGSASVTLTSSTTTLPTLAAPPANTVLDELDHIATLAEACFKDAPTTRVTTSDSFGNPTALSAACDAVPFTTTYKSGGYTSRQRYSSLLKSTDFTGAVFSKPEKLFTTADGAVYFRMAYKTAAGDGGILTDIARKNSQTEKWEVDGNQRDYNSSVETRLDNLTQLNPSNTQEGSKSQYRVAIRLVFDPSRTGGKNVQLIRVKGPGLPANGVVMHRSSVCGANDYMTITNKTGALVGTTATGVTTPFLYNSGGSNNFKLAAELKTGTFDWSKVTSSSSWSTTALTDVDVTAIPAFAEYTFELWHFAAGVSGLTPRTSANLTSTTAPDFTYKQRISSRPPAITSLKNLSWNTLASSTFLDPNTTTSSLQTSSTVNWTPTAEPVDGVSSSGQKFTATTDPTQATSLIVNADTSATGVKISARTATVTPASEVSGIESLRNLGVTIPSCSTASYPTLDTVMGTRVTGTDGVVRSNGTYRDQVIRSRAANLTRKYVANSWNNFID